MTCLTALKEPVGGQKLTSDLSLYPCYCLKAPVEIRLICMVQMLTQKSVQFKLVRQPLSGGRNRRRVEVSCPKAVTGKK